MTTHAQRIAEVDETFEFKAGEIHAESALATARAALASAQRDRYRLERENTALRMALEHIVRRAENIDHLDTAYQLGRVIDTARSALCRVGAGSAVTLRGQHSVDPEPIPAAT